MKFVMINSPSQGDNKIIVGGKVIGDDVVIAINDGVNTIVKVISVLDDSIGDIIEVGTPLFKKMIDFFNDIFNHLPTVIDFHGVEYRQTLQPARGKAEDKFFYLIEPNQDGERVLFETSAPTRWGAKDKMHKLLKEEGIIS